MSRERRSKLDPLSRIITLGEIDPITVNEVIQDIYEINAEDAKRQIVEPMIIVFGETSDAVVKKILKII